MSRARTMKAGRTGKSGKGRRAFGPVGPAMAGPVLMVLCVSALPALAGPEGERVVRGEASFHRQGRNTTITAGNNTVIEYDSFNIRRRQTVEFIQPDAGARVLNRITGPDPTNIRGTLRSNGIVYIVNPAGVIFGPTATIDVGGIYAAGGGLSNRDFLAGNNNFTNVTGRVVNHGNIRADSAVGLIGNRVANFGTVVAPTGTVTMVAGDEVWIGERGGNVYARFTTDAAREAARGGVENHGTIVANRVHAGVGDYYALAVFDSSYIQARTVALRAGVGTTTHVAGTIDVSDRSAGGVGGSVTVTGERVALRDARIDASGDAGGGSVRIGGDYQGGRAGGENGQAALNNAERTFVSSGTTINADAVTSGNGGRVIVWSDVFTNYNGSITARGGAEGGNGGFAEVSGKEVLAFQGTANLSATAGDAGTLLLDPKNITIENGGAAPVATNNEFGENQSASVSMDADLITAILDAGTSVILQANNDIVVDEDIVSVNPGVANGGNSGDLTLQAGRSVDLRDNISLENGNLTIVANETVANGVINAERDAGAAVIDMGNNVSISTGSGNVTLTVSTGAGLTNSTSGNIFVEDITTTGTVTITNNGPTAGSSIVIDPGGGNNSLLTAGNLVLVVGGAGGGGTIGSSADPIAFTVTNIEASTVSGGIFLDTTSTVNVGGASGSLTGISTSTSGAIEITTGAGNLNISENIAGAGTIELTSAAIGIGANVVGNDDVTITGPVTITGSRTVSAGAGQLEFSNTVTLSGAGATVTMVGTPSGGTPAITFNNTVTADAGGSNLVLEQGAAGTAFNIATGTDDLLEATDGIDQLQDGFTSIIFGRSDGTASIGVGAVTFIDPVTIRTTTNGSINVNGAITGNDNAFLTFNPGAGGFLNLGLSGAAITTTSGADITVNGNVRVGTGFSPVLATNGGLIDITGNVDGTAGGAAENISFDVDAGNVTIGGSLGTGQANGLNNATIVDAFDVTLGGVNINGTLATTNALTGAFNATGSVAANAVSMNGTTFDFDAGVSMGTGQFRIGSTGATSVNFDTTLASGAGGIEIDTTGAQTYTGQVSTTGGGIIDLDGGAITLTGGISAAGAGANVAIRNSGTLAINGNVTAAGSFTQTANGGGVTVAADVSALGATFNSAVTMSGSREISATTGALAFNSTLGFSTAAGTGTLTGGTVAFGNNVTPNGGGTTLVFQSPDATTAFGVATGLANELVSAASLAFLQDGFTQIVFGRSNGQHNIGVGASTFTDPVLFRTPTSGNITVTGLITGTGNASVTLDTGAGPARILLDVTGNAIVTAGQTILFDGLVRVLEGEAPVINSAGGLIRFGGAVDGTTGGAAESLTLNAGVGTIDFQTTPSAVSGAGGAADATGLTTLTITNAGNLSVQSILISGVFSTSNALTGAFQAASTVNAGTITLNGTTFDFDAAVTAGAGGLTIGSTAATTVNFDSTLTAGAGGITIDGTTLSFTGLVSTSGGGDVDLDGGAITLTGGITTAGANANVDITNSGLLSINGAVSANGTFTQHDNGGTVSLGANVSTASADGTIQFNSAVALSSSVLINAGGGIIDLNANFNAGANSVIFQANDFQPFADNSITGTGAGQITLRPENASDTIGLGNSGGQTANYSLADFAAIADGAFARINIGHTGSTHDITMSGFSAAAALRDEWFIDASSLGGTITLVDDLDTGGNDLTFDGVVFAGGNFELNSRAAGLVTFTQTANFLANDVALTGDNTPDFQGNLVGTGNLTVRPFLDTTAIDIGNVVAAGGVAQGGMTILNGFLGRINATSFASVAFGYATTGEHSIQIGNTAAAGTFNSDITFHAPAGAGLITVLANFTTNGVGNANADGNLTFDGDVIAGNPVTIASSGLLSFEQNLNMNGNNVTLTSGDLAFNGGANSVSNSGAAATLTLGPADSDDDIDVGNLGGNARAGVWSLDNTDLAALAASVGSIGLGTPTTGTHLIFVGQITGLNVDLTLHAPATGGEARLFNNIATTGRNLTFNADVRIANTANPTITTAGGNLAFNFDIFGSTTGAAESLTINAGTGNVSVAGFIAGQSTGVSNSTGLTSVSITGNNVTLGTVAGAGAAVDLTGNLIIDHAGTLAINDDVLADGAVSLLNSGASGSSVVTIGANVEIAAASATGVLTIGANSTLNTNGQNVVLTANEIEIVGAIQGGNGTNTLTLRPDATTTAIEVGNGTANAAGSLLLTNAELARIADGFGGIHVGYAGTGQHAFSIGTSGFNDPVTFHAPGAGGSFEILASRSIVGAGNASITFRGNHSTLVLNNGSQIVTAGQDINIEDNIRLADGAGSSNLNADIPLISTGAGAGNITIDGSVFGTAGGSSERLRLRAGTGSITVGDVLTANSTVTNITGVAGGAADATGLIDLRIVGAGAVTLEGVNIAGTLSTESALTGAFTANEEIAAQALSLAGTTFNFLDGFAATNNGGGNAAFTNSGTVTTTEGEATGDITTTGNLTAVTLDADGSITVGGDLNLGDEANAGSNVTVTGTTNLGERIVAGGNITLTDDATFAVNPGAVARGLVATSTITTGGQLITSGQDVTLRAAEINFNGGGRSVTGGGTLTLRPFTAGADIRVGFASDAGAPALDLTDTDLAALDSGFTAVVIGVANGTHDITLSSSSLRNPTVFNYQNGTMLIQGPVTAAGAGSTLQFLGADNGGTTLAGNITAPGVFIDDNVTLGANSTITIDQGTGTAEIDGTVNGAFELTILGGDGSVEIDGLIGGTTALAALNLSGDNVTIFSGIGTPGSVGVTGDTFVGAVSSLVLGGNTYNTNAAIYRTGGTGSILGTGSGSTASFTSNGSSLTLDGGGTFTIDTGVSLTADSDSGTINLGASFDGQAGAILFDGPVVLTAHTSVNNQGTAGTSTVTFNDTVDGAFDLAVTTAGGSIFFQGDIGATTGLRDLTVNSAREVSLQNIGSGDGPGVVRDAVIAAGDSILYNATLYSTGSGLYTSGTGAGERHAVLGGPTEFNVRRGDITFAGGNIVLANGAHLTVNTEGGNGTFTAIRANSDENLTFELLGGTATFAAIGSGNEIGDILISAGDLNLTGNVVGNNITIRGGTISRNIELAGDGSLGSALRISRAEFARLINGFNSITIGRANGEGTIVVGGDAGGPLTFNDNLNLLAAGTPISSVQVLEALTGGAGASFTIDTGIALLRNNITTAGQNVTIGGSTLLGADVTITTAGGNVSFTDTGTIDSQTAGGPFGLTVSAGSGTIGIDGAVGAAGAGQIAPAFLDLTGSAINIQQVNTAGRQSYVGATTLNGNLTSTNGPITVDGPANLTTNVTISSGSDLTFASTLGGGGNALTVTAVGTAAFERAVTGLSTIEVTANAIQAAAVTSTGSQTYDPATSLRLAGALTSSQTGNITIDGDLILTANSSVILGGDSDRVGNINISGTITSDNGPFNLTLDGAQGVITVGGDIGGSSAQNNNLRIRNLDINGPASLTTRGIRVSESLSVGTRNATFNGPIDSDGGLTVDVNERIRFNGTVDVASNAALSGTRIDIGNDASDAMTVGGLLLVGPNVPELENRVANVVVNAPVRVEGADLPPGGAGQLDIAAMRFHVNSLTLNCSLEVTRGDIRIDIARRFLFTSPSAALLLNGRNFDQLGEGTSILGRDGARTTIESRAGRISFAGPVQLAGDVTLRAQRLELGGGVDDDADPATRDLTLRSGGQIIISDDIGSVRPIGSFRTLGDGTTTISANIIAAGPMTFGQAILLAGNSTIDASAGGDAGSIVFESSIDEAQPDPADPSSNLTVLTAVSRVVGGQTVGNYDQSLATITFRGPIGFTRPIDSLRINTVTNRSSFGARTVVVQGFNVNNVTAALVPTIIFDPTELTNLGSFTTIGPANPTGALVRTNSGFSTGVGEKLVATFPNVGQNFNRGFNSTDAPTLAIIVENTPGPAGNIDLPDVVVNGNLLLDNKSTGSIRFLQRAAGPVLTSPPALTGNAGADQIARQNYFNEVNNPSNFDTGADVFANGFFYFNKAASVSRPLGGNASMDLGSPFFSAQGNLETLVAFRRLDAASTFDPASLSLSQDQAVFFWGRTPLVPAPAFILADIRADGLATNAAAVQQIAPPESQSGTVEEATSIGTSAMDLLRDAGIDTRYPNPEEFLDMLLGRALYDDLSSTDESRSDATVNRFDRDIAAQLAAEYSALFRPYVLDENGNRVVDPETGQDMVQDRRPEIKARLEDAMRSYSELVDPFDPVGFRQFVRTTPEFAQVESDLRALESILSKFRSLGLSPREYIVARRVTLSYVRPSRSLISPDDFIAVVEGAAPAMIPAPASNPAPAPIQLIED